MAARVRCSCDMPIQLTPPTAIYCVAWPWRITPEQSWNSRTDSLRRRPAETTSCAFAGREDLFVLTAAIRRLGLRVEVA